MGTWIRGEGRRRLGALVDGRPAVVKRGSGHDERKAAKREKGRLDLLRRKQIGACKIQSVWRMKVSKEEFRSMRIHMLASIEIQRCYRGYLGRKRLARRQD